MKDWLSWALPEIVMVLLLVAFVTWLIRSEDDRQRARFTVCQGRLALAGSRADSLRVVMDDDACAFLVGGAHAQS